MIRIPCDHLQDDQTEAAYRRIANEAESLDVLVNYTWGGYELEFIGLVIAALARDPALIQRSVKILVAATVCQ